MLEDAPPLTGQARLDALLGAIAEYLAKQYELDPIPAWVSQPERVLRDPWFTTTLDAPGIKEFLAYSSPAEFKHRNIFTEARPLRRASMNHSRVRAGAPSPAVRRDRKSGVSGKRVSVSVDLGGRRLIKKKK